MPPEYELFLDALYRAPNAVACGMRERRALALPIDWTRGEADTIKTLREDRRIMDGINAIANRY